MQLAVDKGPNLSSECSANENLLIIAPKKKRNSYTIEFKREVLQELIRKEESRNVQYPMLQTSKEMNVEYKLIQKWSRSRVNIFKKGLTPSLRKVGCGRKKKRAEVEEHMVKWVHLQRGLVTPSQIARECMREFPESFETFEKCLTWVYPLLDRNNLAVQRNLKPRRDVSITKQCFESLH
jgi:hypothetical protein